MSIKFLILTDSVGNPRAFPKNEVTQLEETYPYILREHFNDAVFWQLSFGNVTTEQLIDQAIGYLSDWNPDYIIIHSGIIDSRPEAFTEFQKIFLERMTGPIFSKLKMFVYNPAWIKNRKIFRVSKVSFKKTAKKLRLMFDQSKIFWLEICAADGYERSRPGVQKRIVDYNQILEEIYNNDLIWVKAKLLEVNGFNEDNLHWNKCGHKAIADVLIKKIDSLDQ